jgi:hypothetical protein
MVGLDLIGEIVMGKGEIKRDYRYWPDWNLIGSCWYGRLFIRAIPIMWVVWLILKLLEKVP